MVKTNLADAKARLSEYLDRALAGEHVVICRHNQPVAELRALAGARLDPRPIGPLPGRPTFDVPPSFFEPLPTDELEAWEGALPTREGRSDASPTRVAERRPGSRRTRRTPPKRRS